MAQTLINVTNISSQVIELLYGAIDSDNSTSNIPAGRSGLMKLAPGASVELELPRVDAGQLENLRKLNVISYTKR